MPPSSVILKHWGVCDQETQCEHQLKGKSTQGCLTEETHTTECTDALMIWLLCYNQTTAVLWWTQWFSLRSNCILWESPVRGRASLKGKSLRRDIISRLLKQSNITWHNVTKDAPNKSLLLQNDLSTKIWKRKRTGVLFHIYRLKHEPFLQSITIPFLITELNAGIVL